jgi:hypothetical protein
MCSRTAGYKQLYMLYGIPLPLTPCHAFRSTSGSADVHGGGLRPVLTIKDRLACILRANGTSSKFFQ